MASILNNLLLFFERPSEPNFMPKGEFNKKFLLPLRYYPEAYQKIYKDLKKRFGLSGSEVIVVKDVPIPDLLLPEELRMDQQFSTFIPKHQRMAARLIEVLMNMTDLEELQSVCAYCQLRINAFLFQYCLSVALLNRPDTKSLNLPPLIEVFPSKFMDSRIIGVAKDVLSIVPTKDRKPVEISIDKTASDRLPEQRVAYFREDIGVNLHHWHWHLVYPGDGPRNIVVKDRRGELFYYMHQQIIARYAIERMCNDLGRVKPLVDLREPIAEAYFPKLDSAAASRSWPPRFENVRLSNLSRPKQELNTTIWMMETWRDRITTAIDTLQIIMPDGSKVPLDEETGIDVIGNILEASSMLSPNNSYYGNLHNMGHNLISYAHDPDDLYLEDFAVMGDTTTAMRDPVFYRWHAFIDDMFARYKNKLKPYSIDTLSFPDVHVTSVSVETAGQPADQFHTLWERNNVELSNGLDFAPRGEVRARFTYLQHEAYDFVIEVNNASSTDLMGTVRVFMAPTVDEHGHTLKLEEQRRLMIEMDKFSHKLSPGVNSIRRKSTESSVAIPYEVMFRDQSKRPEAGTGEAEAFNFCGCGWPENMMVPKGTAKGYPMVLFVMVSNWKDDEVNQEVKQCKNAASYCGLRDLKYPDKRAMGFPFDRPAPAADTLEQFLQPNMATKNCTIIFEDNVKDRPSR